jgi:NAD(P) transhydrogenase subunit alpha
MRIGIPQETQPNETRVAATPETVKKLSALGHQIYVQAQAGYAAGITDEAFTAAGAQIVNAASAFNTELVLKVCAPSTSELQNMSPGTWLVGMLAPLNQHNNQLLATAGLNAFALEAIPRITRAQSMDVLSSQANIAGYKAVLLATHFYPRFMPMLMTAAGTVKAARVLVLGAGVAGLQAIATAKRLGAMVEAADVRPAAKEQIASLGAKFIDVPFLTDEEQQIAQGTGGYARPMPPAWLERQAILVAEHAAQSDIIICTALIPGKTAPLLLGAETIANMRPGSVIIDLAAGKGLNGAGNCALTEADKVVTKHGVTLVGYTNLPALMAADASALYARNVFDFIKLITSGNAPISLPSTDEIVSACLICHNGVLCHPS